MVLSVVKEERAILLTPTPWKHQSWLEKEESWRLRHVQTRGHAHASIIARY